MKKIIVSFVFLMLFPLHATQLDDQLNDLIDEICELQQEYIYQKLEGDLNWECNDLMSKIISKQKLYVYYKRIANREYDETASFGRACLDRWEYESTISDPKKFSAQCKDLLK